MSSFGRMAKMTKMIVSIENGREAIVQRPKLSIDDFNRVGRISINRILHWVTASRFAAYYNPPVHLQPPSGSPQSPQVSPQSPPGSLQLQGEENKKFLEFEHMAADIFTFMASTRTVVESAFYSYIDQADFPPVDIRLQLGYVGSASLNTIATLVTRRTGEELVRNINQEVLVDKTTRKPIAVPVWWKDKYSSAIIGNKRLIIPRLDVPTDGTHRYAMRVTWSDTDDYQHTNYESYIRFCLDAAMDAIDKGFYAGFSGDILRHNVATIENLYIRECVVGQELLIDTWQDAVKPRRLLFSISGAAGKPIFQSVMEFHEPSSS